MATLEVTASRITVYRPSTSRAKPTEMQLNVDHVRELDVPAEFEPVDWKVVTTEPIGSIEAIERVVDVYLTRWVIEEFFKALKTGCAFEKRQLGTLGALLNALALFYRLRTNCSRCAVRLEPSPTARPRLC